MRLTLSLKYISMGKLYDLLLTDIRYEEALKACINCGTCSAICPAASFYNYDPLEIMEIVQSEDEKQLEDLLYANKLVKHTKSNAIVLVKNKQLLASGMGQTSRVDALNQAITKAKQFNKDLDGAVMASDAFFPFSDCVEIAAKERITSIIQPGGSLRDQDSIDACDKAAIAMVFTGVRHFKH